RWFEDTGCWLQVTGYWLMACPPKLRSAAKEQRWVTGLPVEARPNGLRPGGLAEAGFQDTMQK
ncbi:MAG TPA: hypothetical protein VEV87_04395, partial [Chitinophagaceae bacterium]|nr:hypothetical protein [Chitinophagaceae bacterium]